MSWLLSPSSATKMTPKLKRNACIRATSARRNEHRGSGQLVVGKVGERSVGLVERVRHDGGPNRDLRGERKQFLAVASGVRGDAAQLPLLEQMGLILRAAGCRSGGCRRPQASRPGRVRPSPPERGRQPERTGWPSRAFRVARQWRPAPTRHPVRRARRRASAARVMTCTVAPSYIATCTARCAEAPKP